MRLTQFTDERQFLTIAEMYPPSFVDALPESVDAKFDWLVERINDIEYKIDAVIISDVKDVSRHNVDTIDTVSFLQREMPGLTAIPTLRLRDMTRKTLHSRLMAAFMLRIDNLLFVTGDNYTPVEEKSYSVNVRDVNVSSAIEIAKCLQHHVTSYKCCAIAPIDLTRLHSEKHVTLALERQAKGADIFFSQPFIGEIEQCIELVDRARQVGISRPIIHCIFPFYSYEDLVKSAERFKWSIDGRTLETERKTGDGVVAAAKRMREKYRSLYENRNKIDGVYFATRGRVEVITAALKGF